MDFEDPEAEIIDTHLPNVRQKDRQERDQAMRLERREAGKEEPVAGPKQYPRRGKTRIPRRLVHSRAIRELGYPYEEEVWPRISIWFIVILREYRAT
jgi:hypothetical protein